MAELTDVVLGGCKKFECRVLGFPRPEIRWYKDGIEITHVKRYNFDFTQDGTISMVMENISHKDQGMYRCRADNSEGTASTSAYLFVRQRRGLLDEDTMSIHSMTMSEVDVDYAERQMDFEGYAKRIQSDFNGEEFLDEFGRKQKFEEILIEDSKSFRKTEGEEGQEKGMKEKPEKVGKNGHLQETSKEESSFYSEECYEGASVKISKTEESESYSASTSLKSESYEETKMSSTVSVEEFQSESKSKESSVLKVETSISESKTSTNASESQSESHMSIESEISSTEYSTEKSKSKLDVESSLENNDKMVTDSRKESKITAESEIYNTKDSTTEEAGLIVKTETNVNNISEEVHGSDLSIESDISSNKYSVEEETVTSVESVSKTSKKQIEEDSISLFSSEVNVEETENDSQLFFQSSDTSIENSTSSSSKTTVEEKAKLTSIEVDIEESSVQQTSLIADTSIEVDSTEGDGSILVDSSSEIETTKYKRKKRMSVEMEIEETSTVEIDMETRVLKSKMLEEIKTLTAEMQTMSKDNVPTDMGSVSSIFSLFSEEGAEESTTPANPSDVLEAKIRSKIQARVLETESNADAESVENIDLTEGEVDEFRIGDEIRAAVRAEHETLAGTQDLALPADSLLDLPMDDKEVLSTSLGHDSGIFEMSTLETSVIAGEASVDLVTDDATIDSVSTLESSVTESNTTEVFEEKRSRTGEAASLEVFGRVMEQTAEADSLSTENLDDVSPEEIQIKKSGESLDQTESKRETALADELDVGISDLTEEVSPCDEDVASPLSQANEKLADKDKLSEAERKQDSFKVSEQILEDNDSSELSDVVSFKSQRAEETADLDQKQLDTTNSQIQTALADEQNVVSDEASSVSNLESLSAEELSICSQIDQKDALSRAKTDQETALADALSSTAEDVSLISELSDLESGKANELLVDDEVEGKPSLEQSKSSKQSLFTDELVGKDDSSIVSDLTDLESIKVDECTEDLQSGELNKNVEISQDLLKTDELGIGGDEGSVVSDIKTADSVLADEMSVDGQSELGEVKVQSEETWHAEQMSDTESLRDEIREMQSGDASVEADVSQEAVGEIGNAEKTRDNILISETELGQSNEFVEDLLDSNAGNSVIDREPKDLDKLQSKDVVKSFDASSRDVTPTPENVGTLTPESLEAEDQLSIQSAINEETVSTISEGSVREADDFGMDEMLPSGGQFITSPSDLTSLVRDGQKTSRVSAQLSEELAHDMIDGALKDLELDSSVVTKEPSPDHVDVKSEEDILEAPEERKKYKVEDQELSFLPSDEPVEKKKTKTKKSKKDDELTFSTSVETSETTADTMENGSLIQAEVDISEVKYDDDGMLISASIDVEEVRHPPQVVRVSEDVNVNLGETIHLESEVTGSPQPDVKWFKEGEKVGENQRITLVTNDNVYSLDICEAEGSDGGKYTLTAHNSEGTIFSDVHVDVTIPQGQDDKITMEGQNISVTATLSLPEFTRPPEDATVSEFDPVTFVCEVTGNPEPNVNWRKEGKKLKADSKMRIYESDGQHFLEIPQSSFLDAGEYECEATNSEGTTSCHVVLTVEAATEQESGLSAAEEVAQPSESDVRTRYLKLVGAAAAFTLVAFGLHKLTQGRLPR